jgi:hypothetical protein
MTRGVCSQPRENRAEPCGRSRSLAELATRPFVRGVNGVSTNAVTRQVSCFPALPIDIPRSSYNFRLAVLSSVRGLIREQGRMSCVDGVQRPRPACVTGRDPIRQPRRQWNASRWVEEERQRERDQRHRFVIELAQYRRRPAEGGRPLIRKFRGYLSLLRIRHFNKRLSSHEIFFHRRYLNTTSAGSPSSFEATHLHGRARRNWSLSVECMSPATTSRSSPGREFNGDFRAGLSQLVRVRRREWPDVSAGGCRFIRRGPVGFSLGLFSMRRVVTPSRVLSTVKGPYALWVGYIRTAPHQHG